MYRKQVRRRRAVLALLIVSSFVLLTVTYGQGSGGLQRGVSTIFGPLQGGRRPGAEACPRPGRLGRRDLRRARRQQSPQDGAAAARDQAVAGQAALQENTQLRKLVGLDRGPAFPPATRTVTGRVIARSPTVWYSSVTIDVGSGDGVRGRRPGDQRRRPRRPRRLGDRGSSQVTLITDHSSAVSAKVVPDGVQGVIKPEVGNPDDLILDFIDSTKRVHGG